ncbi:MAG: hypothetical protein CUN57_03130, partial [Phototrophicales bacterium]
HKVLNLLLVGSFFGHDNLSRILKAYRIDSHHLHEVWRKLDDKQVGEIITHLFWNAFQHPFRELAAKSESTWSRAEVTVVVDSSIYKHLLQDSDGCEYHDKFFSSQFNAAVYGFRLTLLGVV